MKKVIFFCLIICLCLGCENSNNSKDKFLKFDFKNKNLHKLFYGNIYYKVNGFSSTYKGVKYRLSKPNNFFILESELNEFNNNNKIILFDEDVDFELYIHDLDTLKTEKLVIEFNNYLKKTFSYFPVFSLEFLEKAKNRNSKIYTISNEKLEPFFIDDLNYQSLDELKSIKFYNKTLKNLKSLGAFNLFPKSYSDFFIIHNPITNYYSLFPDIKNFKNLNNKLLFPEYSKKINKIVLKKKLHLKNDTIIKNDWKESSIDLTVSKGVKIILENNASIFIKNSNIIFEGDYKNNVVFFAKGTNSLYFDNISDAKILYTKFQGFSNLKNDSIALPSGITFYNSNVEINHSLFSNNKRGDDFLNLYNSDFNISNTTFQNVISDAIDSDFSNGTILNSKFINIGNDAIDLSGSKVIVKQNLFNKIGDKSVSAGENSILKVKSNTFKNSELGIVVKDGSEVISENNIYNFNKLDIAVFRKKNYYDQPILKMNENLKSLKYLIQNKSKIISKSTDSIIYTKKVEQRLYGNEYGKSSN